MFLSTQEVGFGSTDFLFDSKASILDEGLGMHRCQANVSHLYNPLVRNIMLSIFYMIVSEVEQSARKPLMLTLRVWLPSLLMSLHTRIGATLVLISETVFT